MEFVLLIYHRLVTMYPELKSSSQLAIISPYGYQVKTFKDRFKEMFGSESEAERVVDINTVDGFQVKYSTLSHSHFNIKYMLKKCSKQTKNSTFVFVFIIVKREGRRM